MIVADAILFCAVRNVSAVQPSSPFLFNQITTQRGQSYDLSSGLFTPQLNGAYVIHFSSGLFPGTPVSLSLEGYSMGTDLSHKSTSHNGWETTSRDAIYTFTQGTKLYISLYEGKSASNVLKQSSWSAYLLDSLMYPLITFFVGRNSSFSGNGKVIFTSTFVNVGNAWNSVSNIFTAPRNGTYVFSMSCGAQSGQPCHLYIKLNSALAQGMAMNGTSRNGTDMTSRTFAMFFAVNSTMYVTSYNASLFSDNGYQLSFSGFLYEPVNGISVIWSVNQKSSMSGQYSPFPFNDITVNIGNGWRTANNTFIVPYAGVYQLHLTCTTPAGGVVDYRLMWNGIAYANIYSNNTINNGLDTRSRAIMIEAAVGDTFYIATTSTTKLYSEASTLISFTGYLLSL